MQIKAAVLRASDAPYAIEDVELADPGAGEIRGSTSVRSPAHSAVAAGPVPVDKLKTSLLDQINEAEQAAIEDKVVKPVLLTNVWVGREEL